MASAFGFDDPLESLLGAGRAATNRHSSRPTMFMRGGGARMGAHQQGHDEDAPLVTPGMVVGAYDTSPAYEDDPVLSHRRQTLHRSPDTATLFAALDGTRAAEAWDALNGAEDVLGAGDVRESRIPQRYTTRLARGPPLYALLLSLVLLAAAIGFGVLYGADGNRKCREGDECFSVGIQATAYDAEKTNRADWWGSELSTGGFSRQSPVWYVVAALAAAAAAEAYFLVTLLAGKRVHRLNQNVHTVALAQLAALHAVLYILLLYVVGERDIITVAVVAPALGLSWPLLYLLANRGDPQFACVDAGRAVDTGKRDALPLDVQVYYYMQNAELEDAEDDDNEPSMVCRPAYPKNTTRGLPRFMARTKTAGWLGAFLLGLALHVLSYALVWARLYYAERDSPRGLPITARAFVFITQVVLVLYPLALLLNKYRVGLLGLAQPWTLGLALKGLNLTLLVASLSTLHYLILA